MSISLTEMPMSHQEANKIRRKLVPFMTLLLAVACMGLLASCGGGSATTNNSVQVIPADGTTRRTVTAQDVVVGEVTGQKYVAGELLIYLRSANDQSLFVALLNTKNWMVVAYDEPLNLYTVQTYAKNESELISFKSELERLEYVSWTKFNNVLIGPKAKTSDPSWLEDAKSWNLNAINFSEARDLISGYALDTSINVGIVDSKFTNKHEDLKFKSIERDAGDEPIGQIAGVRGGRESSDNPDHGMHVSGIIGSLQNSNGTVGISPEALLNGADPYNTNGLSTNGAIGRSISNLKKTGSRVINISLGNLICDKKTGQCTSQSEIFPFGQTLAVKEVVSELYGYIQLHGEGNVLFVQSSGNDGGNFLNKKIGEVGDASQRIYADHNGYVATALSLKLENETSSLYGVPKNYGDMQEKVAEHSLIVGSYVSNNGVKAITSYTQIPSQNAELLNANFLLAPGGDSGRGVYSAVLPGLFNSGEYDYMNGTSMAAPHVSGVAALLLQINPLLKSWDIRKIILDNSDVVDGYRALNAEKAVKAAIERLPKPTATISIITPKPTAGTDTILRADVTSTPNGAVTQIEWDFGDGTVQMQTGSEMFHTYTSGGTYTVKLKIKDVKGVTNTTTKEITVAGVAVVPTIADLTFTPATANTAAKLTAIFSTDMQSGYFTTGAYSPIVGKEGYWPDARTFVVEFSSVTSGGQITLVASGFKSVSGQPMAADRVYTFPAQPTQNLLLGAPVTDSCIGCTDSYNGALQNITDGNLETARNIATYSGTFHIFLDSPKTISLLKLLPAMSQNGLVNYEIQTSTDPRGAIGTWMSHGGVKSSQWANNTWFDFTLNTNTQNIRVIKVNVTSTPSWLAFFEIEGYAQ